MLFITIYMIPVLILKLDVLPTKFMNNSKILISLCLAWVLAMYVRSIRPMIYPPNPMSLLFHCIYLLILI